MGYFSQLARLFASEFSEKPVHSEYMFSSSTIDEMENCIKAEYEDNIQEGKVIEITTDH